VTPAGERDRIEVRLTLTEKLKSEALLEINTGGEVTFAAKFQFQA
jgi:hypothetical protein